MHRDVVGTLHDIASCLIGADGRGRGDWWLKLADRRSRYRFVIVGTLAGSTPFCITCRPIDKTFSANLQIGCAGVSRSSIIISLSS